MQMSGKLLIIFFNFILLFCKAEYKTLKNVLFIVVDDLRPALGVYGDRNAYTPNIDRLASNSILFTHAYAQQALCGPSRNSFLTSRRPDTLHLYDFDGYWRENVGNFTTLPQYFKEHGYITHSVGKIFHNGSCSNWTDDYPYSWSQKPFHPSSQQYMNAPVCPDKFGHRKNLVCPVHVEFQPEQTLPDLQSLEEAKQFLRQQKNSINPYFLGVGFHKPHEPLKFPKNYLDFHPIENITIDYNTNKPYGLPTVAWNPWSDIRRRDDIADLNIEFPYGKVPMEWTKKIVQSYNAAVTYIDHLIGELLDEVDDNTIVAFIGDHGWSLGEHGEWSKFSNFDVATRVPFILRVPKRKPRVIKTPVELVDVFPTLVDLAKLSPTIPKCDTESPENLCTEGESLVKLISNEEFISTKFAFSQYPRPTEDPSFKPSSDKPNLKDIKFMGYTMVNHDYRYTEWVEFNNTSFLPNWDHLVGVELYNHEFDSTENINLANKPEMENVRKQLSEILRNQNDRTK